MGVVRSSGDRYTDGMLRRGRFLFRVSAIVLLTWAAVDMTNPGLCALDNERATCAPVSRTMLRSDWSAHPGGEAARPHIDDCFCCSHCLEPGQIVAPGEVTALADRLPATASRLPFRDGTGLYHPPLFLG